MKKYPTLKDNFGRILLEASYRCPRFVGELMIALDASVSRLGKLPKNSPERIIESSARRLSDTDSNRKLAEALPKLNENELSQVRDRLAKSNRTVLEWHVIVMNKMAQEVRESGREDFSDDELISFALLFWIPLSVAKEIFLNRSKWAERAAEESA
ncbi:hypothetical protein N9K67_06105 [Opitutaceae bacterium]|nr:hypothetical protein [Opitutaceae bacterium]